MPLTAERTPWEPLRALDQALAAVERIADEVAGPHAEEVDRDARWPEEAVRALQAGGLGGLVVPIADGGLGHGLQAVARACELLGRRCASSALCFGMHCVGAAVLAAKATPYQAERYLRPIAAGAHLTTLALSEPGTGAHFYLPQTRMERDGDGFRLEGRKTFVTNGGRADSYVISAAGDEVGDFSCLVLPAQTPGIAWGPPWQGLGMRGNASLALELDGAAVSSGELLGREGDEIWYVFRVVAPYFLMAMAGTYLGIAAAALEEARAHLVGRRYGTSGRPLAAEPVLQHRFGELWAGVERTRRLVYHAAARADAGDADALPALLSAKAEVADCAVVTANEAMTLCGGIAYREGASQQRHLRDARAAHVMAPTTDMLRVWTGRALLDQPLLAD